MYITKPSFKLELIPLHYLFPEKNRFFMRSSDSNVKIHLHTLLSGEKRTGKKKAGGRKKKNGKRSYFIWSVYVTVPICMGDAEGRGNKAIPRMSYLSNSAHLVTN